MGSHTIPNPEAWNPIPPREIHLVVNGFSDWVLCGGHAVALWCGVDSRDHGDTDIGVFRSQVETCLSAIGRDRVFLCENRELRVWDGKMVPPEVHDIWVTNEDQSQWILQIMIYDDDGDRVSYRRNPKLSWSKDSHRVIRGGFPLLNPFVAFLFKSNQETWRDKEVHDLSCLIESVRELDAKGGG